MVAREPSEGGKVDSMSSIKVSAARVPPVRWVESRYALQRMVNGREKQQVGNLEHKETSDAWKVVGNHINGGVGRIGKDSVNQTDKRGWMKEMIRAPSSSMATTLFADDGIEDSRVWGEEEVWKVDARKQEAGGDHANLASWQMDEEGVEEGQRGLQGGSSQGLPMVESEAKEYTLQVENLLNECGQAHNAHNTCTRGDDDKDLKMVETSDVLDVFLSEEESTILNAEIKRLKKCSFICKLFGGRPNRGMVRDMLQVALMDKVPHIKSVDNMGRNFFHIEVNEGSDVSQIINMKCVELKYGRALLLEWHANFNVMDEAKKIGNPMVISMVFPNLPRHLYPLMQNIGEKIGTICPSKASMVDKIRDSPKIRVLVQSLSTLPSLIRVHDVEGRLIDVEVEYEGLPGQCFYCKRKGHIAKECPRKINRNVRGEKDTGLLDKQEPIRESRLSNLIGAEKANNSANGWTRVSGRKNGLQREVNTNTPHADLRNRFEVLQEEEDLAQDSKKTIVEEVVVCTPEVMLKSGTLRQESTMGSPSSIGKSGSMGLRAMKDWLRNGRCQESSPIAPEIKLQAVGERSKEANVRVPIKFVRSKILEGDMLDKGYRFSQQALTRLTDLSQGEALGLRVYVIVAERNKLPAIGFSFDLTDLEVTTSNMPRISNFIEVKAHKYFRSLPINWNGDNWRLMWLNAGMICGSFHNSCIKKQILLCLEEMIDPLDEVLHFHEEEMAEATRQDVVLGWERIKSGGWAWARGEGLCPAWETSQLFS